MQRIPKRILLVFALTWAFANHAARAEDLAAALAAGRIKVTIHGNGGSTGDTIEAVVEKADKTAADFELTIAPGTRLRSGDAAAQSMVVAAVKGQVAGDNTYSPSLVIPVGDAPTTNLLEAYCSEFEKGNPSARTSFSVGKVDPVLARILTEAAPLSQPAKQAAVWIYTDKATFRHVNAKFAVSQSDWDAAVAVVRKCSAQEKPREAATAEKEKPKQR
jgi:hypothetical protein